MSNLMCHDKDRSKASCRIGFSSRIAYSDFANYAVVQHVADACPQGHLRRMVILEPFCCKKQQKSSWPVIGLQNRGPLKDLNNSKLPILPSKKTTKRGGGGQKSPILRRHSLWTATNHKN